MSQDKVSKGRRKWLDSRQAEIPQPDIDEILDEFRYGDSFAKSGLRIAKQALYHRLAAEAVHYYTSAPRTETVWAVPLSKLAELMEVPE